MPKLYHCNTIYSSDPPTDLNPLILELYKKNQILAIVARQQQATRISKAHNDRIQDGSLVVLGWWEFPVLGLFSTKGQLAYSELVRFDAIVVVGKDRIDPSFLPIYKAVLSWLGFEPADRPKGRSWIG